MKQILTHRDLLMLVTATTRFKCYMWNRLRTNTIPDKHKFKGWTK